MIHDTDMRLDHVSYAVSSNELVDTVQRLGQQLGGSFVDGGRHPRFGTRNFILPLEGGTYVEVVAALDHPASEKAPFGRAVRLRAESGGGWMAWVVSVDDISLIEQRLGREAVDGHRVRVLSLRANRTGVSAAFTKMFATSGRHTVRIVNLTGGRRGTAGFDGIVTLA